MRLVSLLLLIGAALLAGCATTAPQIAVSEPWVRAAMTTGMAGGESAGAMATPQHGAAMEPMGGTSAAYMTLVNRGGTADRLLAASSDIAAAVELHESKLVDGVMQMAPVAGGIEVPANGQAELKPGGLHVMFIGLKRDLQAGETVQLTLTFERAGAVTVDAPVRMP